MNRYSCRYLSSCRGDKPEERRGEKRKQQRLDTDSSTNHNHVAPYYDEGQLEKNSNVN
ncbi:hypothetical protein EXN66_Car003284 [Channa argus]|uniref:Uncharacterized protein n=1 Tax=Channa argus TaxID=215402 RepID=A0A6G1PBJ8_CHAAH|nr:hypothetical protein EXN66_Car003284 [Channa argus]